MKSIYFPVILLLHGGCHPHGEEPAALPAVRVHCAESSPQKWADSRSLRGTVAAAPDRDAIVSAQVPGRLLRVLGREGDVVARGALLAEVDPRPAQDIVRQAEAALLQTRAAQKAAAATGAREEHLLECGISARRTVEGARAALAQADAAVSSAVAQVDLARQNLERSSVRAPLAGVIVGLLRRTGEVVDGTPATAIAEVADTSALELNASASASDLMLLASGQAATITFDALSGRHFGGIVRAVSPAVDTMTGVGTVLGVERVRSRTLRGGAEIQLLFAPRTDMWRALQLVESSLNDVRAGLPADAHMRVERLSPVSFPVLFFNVSGPLDSRERNELAEYTLRPTIARVPGVGRVGVLGGDVREMQVIVDPERAAAAHLGLTEIAARIRRSVPLVAVGRFEQDIWPRFPWAWTQVVRRYFSARLQR